MVNFNTNFVFNPFYIKDIFVMLKNAKSINRDFNFGSDEGQYYSYATLNKHPLSSLKILGILKKQDNVIFPWSRSSVNLG